MKLEGYRIIPHEISKISLNEAYRKFKDNLTRQIKEVEDLDTFDSYRDAFQTTIIYALKCLDEVAAKYSIRSGIEDLGQMIQYLGPKIRSSFNVDDSPEATIYRFFANASTPEAEYESPVYFENAQILTVVAKTYDGKKPPIYVMQTDFFKKLVETDISEVPLELFPKSFKGYISFERGALKTKLDDGSIVNIIGAYAAVVGGRLDIIVIKETPEGFLSFNRINFTGWAEKTKNRYADTSVDFSNAYSTIDAIGLAVVYISCGNPDLRVLKSLSKLPPSAIRGLRNKGVNIEEEYDDEIPSDVTLVSWSWKKDPRYTQGKWGVRAFFRVQRYGPGRNQTRVIWIAPHLAHRRKDLLTSDDDSSDPEAGNPVDFEFIFGDLY